MRRILIAAACGVLCLQGNAQTSDLRLGMIGTDTSHAVHFTRILNGVDEKDHIAGAHVVAAYRGGSPSYALSRDRIDGFTTQLTGRWKMPFVASIGELCPKVDGLLLLSVDPATREREFKEAAACGKPIFVDKPFASGLREAISLSEYAAKHNVRWFSASALRYGQAAQLRAADLRGADVWGPGALGEGPALDLSWYGIHSIEMLYAVLGPGVQTVSRIHRPNSDVITAAWADGRTGSVHLMRPEMTFGLAVFHTKKEAEVRNDIPVDYGSLLRQIIQFVQTGRPPVTPQETIEVFAFMDAAERSMQQNGAPVNLTHEP